MQAVEIGKSRHCCKTKSPIFLKTIARAFPLSWDLRLSVWPQQRTLIFAISWKRASQTTDLLRNPRALPATGERLSCPAQDSCMYHSDAASARASALRLGLEDRRNFCSRLK